MATNTKTVNRSIATSEFEQARNRLSKKVVLSLLAQMPQGRLEMIMPNGDKQVFGNGSGDVSASVRIHDEAVFSRCLLYADIGLAESYVDGLCDFQSIAGVISWFLLNQDNSPVLNESSRASRLLNILGLINRICHFTRRNSKSNSRKNISEHYDLGNQFFSLFLDKTMTYSSALFADPTITLEAAQLAKFERIAQQLRIERSDRVLDLGCGWGGLSCFIAGTFGCRVTAVTISKEQHDYVAELIRRKKLEHLIELRLEDYRRLTGKFDKIVSIEMIEAVGEEYMNVFVRKLDSLLESDGVLLMQMITCPDGRYDVLRSNVDFIQKHIFPGSLLPSLYRVSSAMRACGELFMVDLFDMTPSYVTTLKRWQESFEKNSSSVLSQGFDERFIRKWRYYFEYCQAAFQMRNVSVVQATYSRPNNRRLAGR
jgi:cyclopropane-fatty-acyl-phospholipid synthase